MRATAQQMLEYATRYGLTLSAADACKLSEDGFTVEDMIAADRASEALKSSDRSRRYA